MARFEHREMIREMGVFLQKYGVTVVTDALMTAVWVEASDERVNVVTTSMGTCQEAEDILDKYDLYVFAYQQLKRSMEAIRDFERQDGANPLAGTYWPCPMR